jgi:acetolactate synthase I/II/III large subunit
MTTPAAPGPRPETFSGTARNGSSRRSSQDGSDAAAATARAPGTGPAPRATTAARAIAAGIAAHGTGPVFGVLGEGTLAVIDALVNELGLPYVATAREDGAVMMADALGRVGGGVGVAALTHGPGLTNAVTALTEAARARTPLVVLVGDTPATDRQNPQAIDQAAVVAPTGAGFQPVRSPDCAPEDVALAFRRAVLERRPVVLDVPTPFLGQLAPPGVVPTGLVDAAPAVPASMSPVAHAAELLAVAERPLVVAGRGAVAAGAGDALRELAERSGALLATTLLAKGLFAGDPYDVGICGGYATSLGRELIAAADCVVAVGTSLNRFTTDGGALIQPAAAVVQIDHDPGAFGRWTTPVAPVVGDARAAALAIADALPPSPAEGSTLATAPTPGGPVPASAPATASSRAADPATASGSVPAPIPPTASRVRSTWRRPETAARLARFHLADEITSTGASTGGTGAAGSSGSDGIDLRELVLLLDELVPDDRTVVVDGGHAALSEPSRIMRVPDPRRFVFPLHFGSIGLALASAVGAALVHPDQPTLCFCGDGGFMMGLAELDTAVRLRLPLTVVVMNDGGYGWEYHQMRDRGMDTGLSAIARPSFAAVARALGARAATATSLAELASLRDELAALDGPLLVDAQLDRDVVTAWYRTHAGQSAPAPAPTRNHHPPSGGT